jgi:hypothetical protein
VTDERSTITAEAGRKDNETLGDPAPARFTIVVFYRGYHCPVGRKYLTELDGLVSDFAARGVGLVVAGTDSKEGAESTAREWRLAHVTPPFPEILSAIDFAITNDYPARGEA